MVQINFYILSFLLATAYAGESSKGDKRQQLGFRPVHFAAVGLPLRDTSPNGNSEKTGAFKIDDGNVVGAGTYEIEPDGVDVDISLKISTKEQRTTGAGEEAGAGGGTTPGGAPGAGRGPAPSGGPSAGGGPGASGGPGAGGTSKPALCAVPCSQTKPTQGPGVVYTTSATPTTGIGGGGATVPNGNTQGTTSPSGIQQVTTPQGATSLSGTPTTPVTRTGPTAGVGAASTPPSGGGSQDEILGLNKHNEYRKVHGVPAMKLNAEMSRQAAEYAQKIAQKGVLSHASPNERNKDGENLSMGCDSDGQTTAEATTNWYNEVCKPGYTFGQESGGGGTGHFTQVVWKGSVELGIGKADIDKNGMKCTYVVGRYRPAGNMMGDYAENVPQGSFNKAQACAGVKRTIANYLTPRLKIHHEKDEHTVTANQN